MLVKRRPAAGTGVAAARPDVYSLIALSLDRAPSERDVSMQQQHAAPLEPKLTVADVAINIWSLRDRKQWSSTMLIPRHPVSKQQDPVSKQQATSVKS